jgi:selenium-binding protein 1
LHDPRSSEGLVGSALYANVYRFYKTAKGDWAAHKVIDIPSKKVTKHFIKNFQSSVNSKGVSAFEMFMYISEHP